MAPAHLRSSILGVALALASASSLASTFTSLTVFGDSLSDTGNVFLVTGGTVPAAPYSNGRFSNGPVWVEYLATGLGLPSGSAPSLAGGGNFAFGGARTSSGTTPVPGLLAQAGGLWNPLSADPTGLYVIVGGGNDLRDARSAFTGNTMADQDGRQAAAEAAVGNLASVMGLLAASGAKNVLLATLPDLGQTPEAVGLGLTSSSSDVSSRFNALIPGLVSTGQSFGLNMSVLDLFGLQNSVMSDALLNGGAVYGITNVFTPCGSFLGSVGASCDISLFSDALHPSAKTHELIGNAALAAVPAPAAVWLLGTALAAVMVRARRSRLLAATR
jgi:phospholipase/lecithinase/hemolysin